ncbi:MAG: glycosyltransferase [Chitinispirillaceae bacterium]|nr:glycosyltransferase [Chitinispirillaceae bacterium]
MKPATVFLVAKYTYPLDTRLAQQVRVLVGNGINVAVLCLREKGQPAREQDGSALIVRLMAKRPKEGFVGYLRSTILFSVKAFFSLSSLSRRFACRVIVVHTLPEFLVFIGFVHKILGASLILDGRDISYELLSSRWHGALIRPVRCASRILERLCTAACNAVITASNGFKRSLVARGTPAEKITVLVNSADTDIFRFDAQRVFTRVDADARLMYHGTVSKRFGILVAVEAMAQVVQKIPGSTLQVHGFYDPSYRVLLEERIQALGLQDAINLGGVLSLDEIARIIRRTDLGIVPYLSDSFMNLALSTKTFEYVASGLPVVASRLASTEELFDEGCLFYTQPGDAEKLALTIIESLHAPEKRRMRRDKAYEAFHAYSTDVVMQRFLDLMKTNLPGDTHAS